MFKYRAIYFMQLNKANNLSLIRKVVLVLVWLVIFLAFPFALAQAFSIPYTRLIPLLTAFLFIIIFLHHKVLKLNRIIAFIFILQILVGCVWFIIHMDGGYINLTFQYVVTFCLYCCILIIGPLNFIQSFKNLMLLMAIFSAITFVLGFAFRLPEVAIFTNQDGRVNYNFLISFSNTVYDTGIIRLIRPSGYFDEPGSLSFYLIILLFVNDLIYKSKRIRYIIIICGATTLSVAFYIILFFYFILHFKSSWTIYLVRGMPLFILAISLYYVHIPSETREVINKFTVDRVTSLFVGEEEAGYNQGNNRSELIKTAIAAIKDSPFIGQGFSYSKNPSSKFYEQFMGANIFGVFGIQGIFGGIIFSLHILYLFYICMFVKPRILNTPKKVFILYAMMIIQRPDYIGGLLTYISVLILIFSVSIYYQSSHLSCNDQRSPSLQ